MFTRVQTGLPASPNLDSQKDICGSCAVCKTHVKSSTEPKLLPCLHTVCHACLAKTRKNESTYECTLCAQSFCLSDVTECNVFEDSSDSNENPKCSACEETEVSGWCAQCEEALCSDCISAHRRVKLTRDHEIKPKKPSTGWIPRRRCPLHSQESLKFFCLVCEELTCKDCQLIIHRGHSFVQQEEAVGSHKQRLLSMLESITKQKERVGASLLLIEARLNDLNDLKSHASKTLAQVVHSIYRSLCLSAKQMLKEVEVLCADEVNGLLQIKTHLNKMEDCQDHVAAFIHKILNTESHSLLVHKKRIETQVIKLLSQKTCPPEQMFELQLQVQKDICQRVLSCGFIRIRKLVVPFKVGSAQAEAREKSNPQSDGANSTSAMSANDVRFLLTSKDQSNKVISAQSQHTQHNSDSLNSVANVPPPETHSNSAIRSQPFSPTVPQVEKHFVFQNCHTIPVSNQTSLQAHPVPFYSQVNQSPRINHQVGASNQSPVLQHPSPAITNNNRTLTRSQSSPGNNQTHALHTNFYIQNPVSSQNHALAHSANNQTPIHPHPRLANAQPPVLNPPSPVLSQSILDYNQPPILHPSVTTESQRLAPAQPILSYNQPPILSSSIPSNSPVLARILNNQTAVLTHPIATNNQTPMLAHPVSNIPTNTPTYILAHPIQVGTVKPMHTFAAQPSIAFAYPSNNDVCNVNDVTSAQRDAPPSILPTQNGVHNRTSSSNLPVRALADSACDQEVSVSSTFFLETDNPENNLPTSTVSEDPEKPKPSSVLNIEEETSCNLPTWAADLPTSFRELVERTCGTVNEMPLLDSVQHTHETPTTSDKTVQSDFDKKESKVEKKEFAVSLQHKQQLKKFVRVALVRLPVSLPSCEESLPEFHIITDNSSDHITIQESHEGQIKQVWRWNEDPIPTKASFHHVSEDHISPVSPEVHFCNVCQSAGATLQCFTCGRAFHSDCHIPPIHVKPCDNWVCLLCLNVNEEIIVYGVEKKHSLNLQDQRKCEKLLLGLLCNENRCLLYSVMRHSNIAEFDIILSRLLGTQKPPYRTAAELVSDVWMLFEMLSTNSVKKDEVSKLQNTFEQQLNESFGESLHASLLSNSNSKESGSIAAQNEKHKMTLKRMREFFITNGGTFAKKLCADKGKNKEDCEKI